MLFLNVKEIQENIAVKFSGMGGTHQWRTALTFGDDLVIDIKAIFD